MRKTKEAFCWIFSILKKHKIPYRISGGVAAKIYGSKRELVDIDIDTTDVALKKILPDVQNFISYGPKRYKDNEWDVTLLELNYSGQEIGIIGTDSANIFDKTKGKWVKYRADFSKAVKKKIYGQIVKFISREDLIDYKQKIRRKVDIEDIKELA